MSELQKFTRLMEAELAAASMVGRTGKVTEVIGTSPVSWEDAAKNAVATASKTLRDLRIAEVSRLDMSVENGKVVAFRARVQLSFKYEG